MSHLFILTKSIILCYSGNGDIGNLVEISILKKVSYGIIIGKCCTKHKYNLKEISRIVPNYLFNDNYLLFIKKVEYIYLMEGFIVKYLNKFIYKKQKYKPKIRIIKKDTAIIPTLTKTQKEAAILLREFPINLLWGITGSGKTLVIIDLILEVMKEKKQTLILVPEIAIAENMFQHLEKYNLHSVIWNSKNQNKHKFHEILYGDALIIIGTRSSVFLPFKNLGLIVVDEEHSSSYLQESTPSYNGRDVAYLRAKIEKIPLILMSATPSAETIKNTQYNKIRIVHLKKRFNDRLLPKIQFVLPQNYDLISLELLEKIKNKTLNNEQVLIFCNRRAIAPVIKCKDCFSRQKCLKAKCVSMLIAHKKNYQCHRCHKKYILNECVYCQSNNMGHYGFGVDKIALYLKEKIPAAKIGVFSSDNCQNTEEIKDFLKKVYNNEFNIIIGTQMIAKGHNFNIHMAILLNIENIGLDFRTAEHSMQTIIQVAGRVGRQNQQGEIYIQKLLATPYDNMIMNQDYESFIMEELSLRKKMLLPPFSKLILIKSIKHHTAFLDRILNHKSIINIFLENYPQILFTCEINNFPSTLRTILKGFRAYKLIIY